MDTTEQTMTPEKRIELYKRAFSDILTETWNFATYRDKDSGHTPEEIEERLFEYIKSVVTSAVVGLPARGKEINERT